jgi:ferredoxin
VTRCRGAPTETFGQSGTARFTLRAMEPGATINISKEQWVQCVRAARDSCPTGSMSGTCRGGASRGNVGFTLMGV